MKRRGYWLAMMVAAGAVVGLIGCGEEAPTGKAGAPSAPAATSTPAAESTGQAIVDTIKTPLDKSRQVEGTLGKAAEKTADTVKDATP
ncbi:MAG: hypothetical protein E6K68_03050 [Nitrospirae bacterium]|nr:MAG: hypothetical protein E6K68_03050 [Nitrospirota bacterium]